MISLVLLLVLFVFLCSLYGIYVSLVKKKNKVAEAFSGIDVQLKKRYDLIPNLLTIAGKFMEHEKTLMTEVAGLRSQAMKLSSDINNIKDKISLDKEITSKMGQILVSVENYPQLKADQPMMQAMQAYNEIEEHISASRRFYNSAVLELNNSVEIFPSSVVAMLCNIKSQEFIQAEEAERKAVSAADYLK